MQLSISEAAVLLGTSEAMLTRWARQGAIPAVEVNNAYYFERNDLESWAIRRRIPLRKLDGGSEQPPAHSASILDAIAQGQCFHDVPGTDSTSLLTNLIQMIDMPYVDKQVLLERVLERESLTSTGIGNGIAIPHPRQPLEELTNSVIITCFPRRPVPFCAVDGKAVSAVFLVLSVNTKIHLKLLSQLAYILHLPNSTDFFLSAPDFETILDVIREHAGGLAD